ncbi:unnamed protein product [Brassica oleracea]|uniref:RING-type E3 ubiquitin transferase n=2 Tax=Brassica oleracea TaxID=3712 RepID=A0A0D3D034_BRAOL|nr:PREDICTED: RING-H2 finger protein ATL3 [Brassica oleracea var. oleracea]VDD64258.1 unnamed protein product [Brassica oleracea]
MDDDGSAHSSLFGDLSTEEVTSKIILTAVIVLFLAVLFVLILHLYAKLYWWRLDHHLQQQLQEQEQEQELEQEDQSPVITTRRQRRRFIFVPGQDALSNTGGLTPFELSSLPVVFFRQDSCKEGLECAICLSELVKGDKARLLPKCSHSFHVECIDMWFQSHSTCPICRNAVLEASLKRIEQVSDNVSDALSQISSSSSDFPTNVLVWGRQDQVSTRNTNVGSQEEGIGQDAVVLDINDSGARSQNVPSSSAMRFIAEEEEPKSPMTTRLRSLRRFLSRDKRVSCSNNSSGSSSAAGAASSVDP